MTGQSSFPLSGPVPSYFVVRSETLVDDLNIAKSAGVTGTYDCPQLDGYTPVAVLEPSVVTATTSNKYIYSVSIYEFRYDPDTNQIILAAWNRNSSYKAVVKITYKILYIKNE